MMTTVTKATNTQAKFLKSIATVILMTIRNFLRISGTLMTTKIWVLRVLAIMT